jgi:uncharacterized membrane protein YjjB (DUF3815 family)
MDWLKVLEHCVWFGTAASGFAVLFNVPPRTLLIIGLLGAVGGLIKLVMLHFGLGPVMASFLGASAIGLLSIPAAHNKHAPPMVFSIAAVIPMVPGVFAYRTMIGLVQLTGEVGASYAQILSETVNNGAKALFILMALAVGVGLPTIITRKESAKEMKLGRRKAVL